MGSFHLVGRSTAIKSLISSVREAGRCGSLIVSDTGLGKTTVSKAVADILSAERRVFRVCGTPALSRIPFAVLAPFLHGLGAGPRPSEEAVIRAVSSFFRGHRSESAEIPLIVVDDAHDVDAESRTILARLVVSDTVRLLVLSPRPSMPLEFLELWTDGFLDRCDLDPLTPDEIHILCETVLQRKVLRSVSAMLGDLSKGSPMLLQALLRQMGTNGPLSARKGVLLLGDTSAPDMQLLERLRNNLRPQSAEESEVLEAAALAEPLPLDLLTRSGLGPVAENLQLLELVTVAGDARPCVRLANPLFADVLRRTVPPARSLELWQKYGDLTESMANDRLIRQVTWALDCGAPLTDELLIQAAQAGNEEFDFPFSLRAAAAIQGSAHKDEILLQTAIAHSYLGHHMVARDRLEHLLQESVNLPVLLGAVLWMCRLPTSYGASAQTRRLNMLLQGTAEKLARIRTGGAGDRDIDTLTSLTDLLGDMSEGRSADAEDALARMAWHTPGIDIRAKVTSLILSGNLLNMTGRFCSGRKATSLALKLVQENPTELRQAFDYVFFQHVKGLLLGGQLGEAGACLADYRRGYSRNLGYFGAELQLLEGILAVRQGQVRSGLEQLRPAIDGLRLEPGSELLPFGLGVMAYAAALCGDEALAEECSETFPTETSSGDKGLHLLGRAYSLSALAVIGRCEDAAQQLEGLARHANSSGLLAAERDVLALSIRLGDAGQAERLAELTSTLDGPLSEVLGQYSRAVMKCDPDALAETAARARREGLHLVAVDSMERAAALLAEHPDRTRRNRAQVLLRQYRALLDGSFVLSGQESSRAGRLTPREQEIVELAVSGQSNREIARTLSLSTRTVEGHLYRIFAKLGVSSRADLLAAETPTRLARA